MFWDHHLSFLAGALALGIVVLMLPLDFLAIPILSDVDTAEEFLRTLWQVEAAALALSLAVVLFLFQAVASSRADAELTEFAEDSHVLKFLDLCIVALVVGGLALLGVGDQAPAGWPASWTAILGGLCILSLSFLFRYALSATSAPRLHERRLARLREIAQKEVEAYATTVVMYEALTKVCEEESIDLGMGFERSPEGPDNVRSWTGGVILDVNLGHLRKAARVLKDKDGTLKLFVHPGAMVSKNQVLASPKVDGVLEDARRSFFFGERERDVFGEAVERAHAESLSAIHSSNPIAYDRIQETMVEVVKSFADAWSRYRSVVPDPLIGAGFTEDPLRRLMRNSYEEMHLAIRGTSREVMFSATEFPRSVVRLGIDFLFLGLTKQGLRLSAEMYRLAAAAKGSPLASLALERSWFLVFETMGYRIMFPLETSESRADRISLLPFANAAFDFTSQLLRVMIDHRDIDSIEVVDSQWSSFLEHRSRNSILLAERKLVFAESQHDENHEAVSDARRTLEDEIAVHDGLEKLIQERQHLRFVLAFWALHRLDPAEDDSVRVFRRFADYFSSPNAVAEAANWAFDVEWNDRGDYAWTNWLIMELPPGEVHEVGTDRELLRTFLTIAVLNTSPEGEPPGIQPYDWIKFRLPDALSILDSIEGDSRLWQAFPDVLEVPARRKRLAAALEKAAGRQQENEDQAIRTATLDPRRVAKLRDGIDAGMAENQWLPILFSHVGRLPPPVGSEDVGPFGIRQWIPKGMLVENSRFIGTDHFGREIGQALVDSEVDFFVRELAGSEPLLVDDGAPRERLSRALAHMRAEEFDPTIVLIPLDWRLEDALSAAGPFSAPPPAPAWFSKSMTDALQTLVDDVPVLSWHSVPRNRAYLVDVSRLGTWRQFFVRDDALIGVELKDFSVEEAMKLTEKSVDLFRQGEAETPQQRADVLRTHVLLTVQERFTLEVLDPSAARRIEFDLGPDEDQ